MNTYDVGDVIRLTATFVNSAGAAVDPSSLVAWHRIIKPNLFDVTTIAFNGVDSMVKLSTGVYYTDVAVNSGGEWHYRFRGYGANAAAVEGKFQVLVPIVGA
jgi:hypothetical protein